MSVEQAKELIGFRVTKDHKTIAITTPIPGKDGSISKKTPVYHLPVYKVELQFNENEPAAFHCDLADMNDLINKLKSFESLWRRYGTTAK